MCITKPTLVHEALKQPRCFIREAVRVLVTGEAGFIGSHVVEQSTFTQASTRHCGFSVRSKMEVG